MRLLTAACLLLTLIACTPGTEPEDEPERVTLTGAVGESLQHELSLAGQGSAESWSVNTNNVPASLTVTAELNDDSSPEVVALEVVADQAGAYEFGVKAVGAVDGPDGPSKAWLVSFTAIE